MSEKVILILVDGMRPDAMMNCGNVYAEKIISESAHTLKGRTVSPSVTLPCHMSLFYGVEPQRHGILTNVYTPQVRPVKGLVEQLDDHGKKCAFYYTWEELRDLALPGHLHSSFCCNLYKNKASDDKVTDAAIEYINREEPDFLFLYLGETDDRGHNYGWMSDEYLLCVNNALNCIKRIREGISDEYSFVITADHGGHKRFHGSEDDEDMLIPICFIGERFEKGTELENASILDLSKTVVKLLDVPPVNEWEGNALI